MSESIVGPDLIRQRQTPCHVSDLHATILHLMGLEHERLTFFYKGLEERITGTRGNVVTKALV